MPFQIADLRLTGQRRERLLLIGGAHAGLELHDDFAGQVIQSEPRGFHEGFGARCGQPPRAAHDRIALLL